MKSAAERTLVGRTLTDVRFVEDYFQMVFGDAVMNVMVRAILELDHGKFGFGDAGFQQALQGVVGRGILSLDDEEEMLTLSFEKGALIRVPLSPKPGMPLERITLHTAQGWIVWD